MNERGKKLISDVALFAISNFGSKILVFLMVPLYTYILSTEEYGIADLFTVTINILFPLLTLAITEGTLRFLLDRDSNPGKILAISLLFIAISTIFVVISSFLLVSFQNNVQEYVPYFIVLYITTSLNTCFSNFARGIDKTRIFAAKGILYTVAVISLNLLFLLVLDLGLDGYLLAMILADIITVFYMLLSGRIIQYFKLMRIDIRLVKEMLRYCLPLIPTILAWWVMQMSDKYVLIWFSGLAISGVYSVAYKIPSVLSIVSTIFNQAWQISAVKTVEDSDYNKFFKNVYDMFFVSSLGICAILIMFAKPIGFILFKKDYFIAWSYVPVLLIAYFFSGLSGVMASAFTAKKKTSVLFYSTLVGAALNLILNFVLIPSYGAIAAAATTMIGFFATSLIREICLRRFFDLKLNSVREVFTYILLICEALVITLDISHCYLISLFVILVLIFLYKGILKKIIEYSIQYIKSILKKIIKR